MAQAKKAIARKASASKRPVHKPAVKPKQIASPPQIHYNNRVQALAFVFTALSIAFALAAAFSRN